MKKLVEIVAALISVFVLSHIPCDLLESHAYADTITPSTSTANSASTEPPPSVSKGAIKIYSYDTPKRKPLKNTSYNIIDNKTGNLLEKITTGVDGVAITKSYPLGTEVKVLQTSVQIPYLKDVPYVITIDKSVTARDLSSWMPSYVKSYTLINGIANVSSVGIPVRTLLQKPELPNGCEITSLTAVLNYNHFIISKTYMSDYYLPKMSFVWKNGRKFGPDPNKAFAGNPRYSSGWFVYETPIVTAANHYLNAVKGQFHGVNMALSSKETIFNQLKKGNPVVIWITLGLQSPHITSGWYLFGTNTYFRAPTNLHCVVLTGFDSKQLYVMDPLKGQVTYNPTAFFNSYEALGHHAMVVVPN